jgi:hypothetical protein
LEVLSDFPTNLDTQVFKDSSLKAFRSHLHPVITYRQRYDLILAGNTCSAQARYSNRWIVSRDLGARDLSSMLIGD